MVRRTAATMLVAGLLLGACGAGSTSHKIGSPRSGPTSAPTVSTAGAPGGATTSTTGLPAPTPTVTAGSSTGTAGSGVAPPPAGPSSTTSPTNPPPSTTSVPAPPPATGAYGTVTAGPTCPVERAGQPCPPRPVSARIDAHAADGRVAASTQSGADGSYRIGLPPGNYTLVVVTGSTYPRCPDTPVTVAPGAATRADISCDTGIR